MLLITCIYSVHSTQCMVMLCIFHIFWTVVTEPNRLYKKCERVEWETRCYVHFCVTYHASFVSGTPALYLKSYPVEWDYARVAWFHVKMQSRRNGKSLLRQYCRIVER